MLESWNSVCEESKQSKERNENENRVRIKIERKERIISIEVISTTTPKNKIEEYSDALLDECFEIVENSVISLYGFLVPLGHS